MVQSLIIETTLTRKNSKIPLRKTFKPDCINKEPMLGRNYYNFKILTESNRFKKGLNKGNYSLKKSSKTWKLSSINSLQLGQSLIYKSRSKILTNRPFIQEIERTKIKQKANMKPLTCRNKYKNYPPK